MWNKYPDTNPDEAGFYLIAYNNILYGKIANSPCYTVSIWHASGYWVDLLENIIVIGWQKIHDFDGG